MQSCKQIGVAKREMTFERYSELLKIEEEFIRRRDELDRLLRIGRISWEDYRITRDKLAGEDLL
jgi:predicted nucleotidyltransferase